MPSVFVKLVFLLLKIAFCTKEDLDTITRPSISCKWMTKSFDVHAKGLSFRRLEL